jgi:hypothetical protein
VQKLQIRKQHPVLGTPPMFFQIFPCGKNLEEHRRVSLFRSQQAKGRPRWAALITIGRFDQAADSMGTSMRGSPRMRIAMLMLKNRTISATSNLSGLRRKTY